MTATRTHPMADWMAWADKRMPRAVVRVTNVDQLPPEGWKTLVTLAGTFWVAPWVDVRYDRDGTPRPVGRQRARAYELGKEAA